MKYVLLGLFALNVYFALQGSVLNGVAAGYMFADFLNIRSLKANT